MQFLKIETSPNAAKRSLEITRRNRRKRLLSVISKSHRFKARSFPQSVGFAIEGLQYALKTQRNFRIDAVMAVLVAAAGLVFQVSTLEWVALVFTIGLVMVFELVNTAIELLVDMWTEGRYDRNAKRIKDVAAGACLLMAGSAACTGLLIFVPKALQFIPGA